MGARGEQENTLCAKKTAVERAACVHNVCSELKHSESVPDDLDIIESRVVFGLEAEILDDIWDAMGLE